MSKKDKCYTITPLDNNNDFSSSVVDEYILKCGNSPSVVSTGLMSNKIEIRMDMIFAIFKAGILYGILNGYDKKDLKLTNRKFIEREGKVTQPYVS